MSGLRTNKTLQQAAEIKDEAVEKDDVQDVDTDATTETNTVVKSTRPQGRYKKKEREKLVHAYSSEDLGGILRDFLFYPPWAFGLPIWVLSIPLSLVESAIWTSLTYYTIGFAPNTSRFLLALFSILQMSLSLFRFVAAVGRKLVVVCTLGTCTLIMNILLGGFIVAQNDIEPFMIWGYYISPVMYGQNDLVINEFLDKRWSAPNLDPRIHAPTVGKVLLKSRGFFTDDYMFWVCVGAPLGFSLLFNILFIAALTFLNPLSDSKSIVLDEDVGRKNKKSSGRMTSEG